MLPKYLFRDHGHCMGEVVYYNKVRQKTGGCYGREIQQACGRKVITSTGTARFPGDIKRMFMRFVSHIG